MLGILESHLIRNLRDGFLFVVKSFFSYVEDFLLDMFAGR